MADSRHPYEKATGGKGDRDLRTDPAKYRAALYWKRSTCCNARVMTKQGKLYCTECGKLTSTQL